MGIRTALGQLLPKSIRGMVYDFLYRPRGIKMGQHSLIVKPEKIECRHCITVGSRCHIQYGSTLWCVDEHAGKRFTPELVIGDDVYIGDEFRVLCAHRVHIGSGTVISDFVYMNDHNHGMDPAGGHIMVQPLTSKGPIEIGESCFIGYRAIILSGVTLGKHCIVAAGSVVTGSYPDYSVIAGNPAKLVKILEHKDWLATAPRHSVRSFKGPGGEPDGLSNSARAS